MDPQTATLAQTIGGRVRAARRARGWTLDQLATAADTSRRSVVNVEQGAANPSVGILLKLSDALAIGLPSLVAPPEAGPALTVTRAGRAPVLWTGEHGGRGQLVGGTEPPDVLELWDWTLGPGDRHDSEAHPPGTQEVIEVLDGTVTLQVGGEVVELEPGDAVPFRGDAPHGYSNRHAHPARFVLTVFEPGVGGRGAGPNR